MIAVIDEIASLNVSAINFYDSISNDIPKNVWLTKYYNKDGDKIAVRGIAQNIVDIYEYYKNLKIISPNSNIKLNDLKVITEGNNEEAKKYLSDLIINQDKDRLYSFEISNTQIEYKKKKSNRDGYDNSQDVDIVPNQPLDDVEYPSAQMKIAR